MDYRMAGIIIPDLLQTVNGHGVFFKKNIKKSGSGTGLCQLFGGPDRSRGVCVRGQLIAMRMGMGRVLWRENRLFYGFMRGMRKGMIFGMMPGIFQITLPVFAGSCFERGFCYSFFGMRCMSRWHNQ